MYIIFLCITGFIYTFLNSLGVQNNFLDGTLGPKSSLTITFRWMKIIIIAKVFFTLIWIALSPNETLEILSELSMDSYQKFIINEKFSISLIRQFILDAVFSVIGWSTVWIIARNMSNASSNPIILFLRVFGIQDPEGDGRSLLKNEESIIKGYHDMLKRIENN